MTGHYLSTSISRTQHDNRLQCASKIAWYRPQYLSQRWVSSHFNPLTPADTIWVYSYEASCLPDQVKPSFVIFDIWALWRSALSVRVPGCQKLQMTGGSGNVETNTWNFGSEFAESNVTWPQGHFCCCPPSNQRVCVWIHSLDNKLEIVWPLVRMLAYCTFSFSHVR